jgi:hypothetical protein
MHREGYHGVMLVLFLFILTIQVRGAKDLLVLGSMMVESEKATNYDKTLLPRDAVDLMKVPTKK